MCRFFQNWIHVLRTLLTSTTAQTKDYETMALSLISTAIVSKRIVTFNEIVKKRRDQNRQWLTLVVFPLLSQLLHKMSSPSNQIKGLLKVSSLHSHCWMSF